MSGNENGRARPHPKGRKKTGRRSSNYESREEGKLRKAQSKLLAGIGVPSSDGEFVLDKFQLEAAESVNSGADTLVVAPTGAGKTRIAIMGMQGTVARGGRVFYTAPLKALSNGKYAEFKRIFSGECEVGLLTGDRKLDADSPIVVATTEIYRNDLFSGSVNADLVIFDEVHYLADMHRGPVWEESIILSPKDATLLMLSASISNAEEIAEWIHSVRGKPINIITEETRPVELRLGYLGRSGVYPIELYSSEKKRTHKESGADNRRKQDARRGKKR